MFLGVFLALFQLFSLFLLLPSLQTLLCVPLPAVATPPVLVQRNLWYGKSLLRRELAV